MIHSLYLDMDGVLVFQHKILADLCSMSEVEFETKVKSFTDKKEKEAFIIPLILESVKTEGFITATPTPFYYEILKLIPYWQSKGISVEILSSAMSANSCNDEIIRQKKMWLKQYNLDNLKAHFPLGSKLKQAYATPFSLLIDDYDRNISQWQSQQGIGILHTDAATTLKELNKYGLNL